MRSIASICAIPAAMVAASAFSMQPNGAMPAQDSRSGVVDQYPSSAGVMYFPPRPISAGDIEYLAWISTAGEQEAALIRLWGTAVLDVDSLWLVEAMAPVRERSSDYFRTYYGSTSYAEKSQALRSVMTMRDDRAASLFTQEGELLHAVLDKGAVDPALRDSIVARVVLAREADAVADTSLMSVHLNCNVLRLMHLATLDLRVDDEAKAIVREMALEIAPRILEQRRAVVAEFLKTGFRGYEAMGRARERGDSLRGAMSAVYRSAALAAAGVSKSNVEVLASVRPRLPKTLADEIEDAYRMQTYGPLAGDPFSFEEICRQLMPLIPEGVERDRAAELVSADKATRAAARDDVLRLFDLTIQRFMERGQVRDPEESERFAERLREYHRAGAKGVAETIGLLQAMAQPSEHWSQADFDYAIARWKSVVQQRIDSLLRSGMLTEIVPDGVLSEDRRPAAVR